MTGPSIAGEVAVRRETSVVFAGSNRGALDRLRVTYRTDQSLIWTSTDLVDCEAAQR